MWSRGDAIGGPVASGCACSPVGAGPGRDYLSFRDPLEMLALSEGPVSSGWPMIVVRLENERDRERVRGAIGSTGGLLLGFLVSRVASYAMRS